MSKGFLLLVSGPAGSGKGSILREALKGRKDVVYSVSCTTRKPREGEVEGESYFFLDRSEFESLIQAGGFLEFAEVHGNYYGTPAAYVQQSMDEGKIVVLEIDVQGAMQVMSRGVDFASIFIVPPTLQILEKRLRDRGTESEEELKVRLKTAERELTFVSEYQYLIVNDLLSQAVEDAKAVIQAEKLKYQRNQEIMEGFKC